MNKRKLPGTKNYGRMLPKFYIKIKFKKIKII